MRQEVRSVPAGSRRTRAGASLLVFASGLSAPAPAAASILETQPLHEDVVGADLVAVGQVLDDRVVETEAGPFRVGRRDGTVDVVGEFRTDVHEATAKVVRILRWKGGTPPERVRVRYALHPGTDLNWVPVVRPGERGLLILEREDGGGWRSRVPVPFAIVSRAPDGTPDDVGGGDWIRVSDWGYGGVRFPRDLAVHFADEEGKQRCSGWGKESVLNDFTAWIPLEAFARFPWAEQTSGSYDRPRRLPCPGSRLVPIFTPPGHAVKRQESATAASDATKPATSRTAPVRGSLDRGLMRRVIRKRLPEVKACYEHALPEQPDLEGRVVVKFTISGSGAVAAAVVEQSTLDSPAVERCVELAVRGWAFPKPVGGGIVVVTYPFVFQPR